MLLFVFSENLLNEILLEISKLQDDALARDNEQAAGQSAALFGWIIKGLAMRGYRHLEDWIDKVRPLFKISDPHNLI